MNNTQPARIYLDHAATTPVDPAVLEAMLPFLQGQFGNPSSLHFWGREARKALQQARESVSKALTCQPSEIIFTSGATEANNLALMGVTEALAQGRHIITTQIEHAAVQAPCHWLEAHGWDVTWLPVDAQGFVSVESVIEALRPETVLVSIIHGNNEIGTLQDIQAIGAALNAQPKFQKVLLHVDAVQTVGKLPLDLSTLPVDYLSLSGHKLYGPKGVGALFVRDGAPLPAAQIRGGGQEGDVRSGTENLAAIVGLAKALEITQARMTDDLPHLRALQKGLIEAIRTTVPEAMLNGPEDLHARVPGNVHFSFPGVEGEAMVLHLDLKGIAVSSGSACHSAVIEPSRIVKALGKSDSLAKGTVRFSLGRGSALQDIKRVVEILPTVYQRLCRAGKGPTKA
ncbi:cysteine desulfurase family protein [Vampirovibrio chlorellavorus]|uniref:cysteine desulfurase family protein n=1 Tax=Vampirovibrio chlorellavorus TaxID=758823 RepID=UPI0026EDF7EB|nr:cysteine desulfurase family protein [Vampirovibrio chlorellavorus]